MVNKIDAKIRGLQEKYAKLAWIIMESKKLIGQHSEEIAQCTEELEEVYKKAGKKPKSFTAIIKNKDGTNSLISKNFGEEKEVK